MANVQITGDLSRTEIEEILMVVQAIERRDPTKQIAILVDAAVTVGEAQAMLMKMMHDPPVRKAN